MGGDFQQYRANVYCQRPDCPHASTFGEYCISMQLIHHYANKDAANANYPARRTIITN